MKRIIALSLAAGLLGGALVLPAEAAKKKKKPKPVAMTYYLHGTEQFGEAESFSIISDAYLKMDTQDPAGGAPKSKQITNYVGGPNTQCAGNTLFPVWTGALAGTVQGDVKVTFSVISSPGGSVDVRIWPDVNSLLCNSNATGATDYIEPAASVTVPLPAGQGKVEALMEGVNFTAVGSLMLQITPVTTPPFFGRVLYDTVEADAKIELTCIPANGASSCE